MDKLLQSLEHYLETKREHDQARDQYSGYSWDYYGRPWVEDMNHAMSDFKNELAAYIDERISEGLKRSTDRDQ